MRSQDSRPYKTIALAYSALAPFFAGLLLWVWHHWHTNQGSLDSDIGLYLINMLAYGVFAFVLACIPSFIGGLLWAWPIPLKPRSVSKDGALVLTTAGVIGLAIATPYFFWLPVYGTAILAVGAIGGLCAAMPLFNSMRHSARHE